MSRILFELPSRLGVTNLWRAIDRFSVPVVALHGVLPDADTSPFNSTGKFITPEKLRGFLERVSRIFGVIPLEEFIDAHLAGKKIKNAMVLTFDDGYRNTYRYAFPVLREMGLPFAVFVTTGFIDSDMVLWNDRLEFAVASTRQRVLPAGILAREASLATPDERQAAILELKEVLKRKPRDEAAGLVDALCELLGTDSASPKLDDVRFLKSAEVAELAAANVAIGGHSVTHPVLSRESRERVSREVLDCKKRLEEITAKPVTSFAYPNGRREDFSDIVKETLIAAGYRAAFTTIHGVCRPGDNSLELRRIAFNNRWTYAEFETRASGVLKAKQR
jgi:peptidoglycan/xylan/chitin deacetylase (PgdA/CDA1 family)